MEIKGRSLDLCALENSRGCIVEAPQLAARRCREETGWAESSFLESGDCKSLV